MPAGGPHTIAITAGNSITLTNVLVGEVWLCFGQSNMGVTMGSYAREITNGATELAEASYPDLRLFQIEPAFAAEPQTNCRAQWQVCTPASLAPFSAVAFFFGDEIRRELKTPVGLLFGCWSGTWAEAWLSREGLQDPAIARSVARWWKKLEDSYPSRKQAYAEALPKWQEAVREARAQGKPEPKKPDELFDPANSYLTPSFLFNAQVAPIVSYGVRARSGTRARATSGAATSTGRSFRP